MDDNEQVLAESYRGFGTLLLAAIFLGVSLFLVWSLFVGKGTISFSETPLLAAAIFVFAALMVLSTFSLLMEKVVVTSGGLLVRKGLRRQSVRWCQVDEIGSGVAIWGRLFVAVRYRDNVSRWRWLSIVYLGFHSGYRDVLRALLMVAESEEYLGKIRVSRFIAEEAHVR